MRCNKRFLLEDFEVPRGTGFCNPFVEVNLKHKHKQDIRTSLVQAEQASCRQNECVCVIQIRATNNQSSSIEKMNKNGIPTQAVQLQMLIWMIRKDNG